MLAQKWRRHSYRTIGPAECKGLPDKAGRATLLGNNILSDLEMLDLGGGKNFVDRIDLAAGNSCFIQLLNPFGRRHFTRMLVDEPIDPFAVLRPPGPI